MRVGAGGVARRGRRRRHALLEDARARDADNVRVLHASAQLAEARGDVEGAREIFAAAAERTREITWRCRARAAVLEVGRSRRCARDLHRRRGGGAGPRAAGVGGYGIERRAAAASWPAWRRRDRCSTRRRRRAVGHQSLGRVGAGRVRRHRRRGPGQGLYTRGLASDPTSACACAGSARWSGGRSSSRRRGTTSSARWTWTPQPMCVRELAMIEEASGNKAGRRGTNVARRWSGGESRWTRRANAAAEIRWGTWAPAEAAAAARGYAAMVKSQSASYTVRYPAVARPGAVRTASGRCSPPRGEGGGGSARQGPRGGAAARRGRAAYVRSRRIRGTRGGVVDGAG